MYTVLTLYKIHPGKLDEFMSLAKTLAATMLQELPGYLGGMVLKKPGVDDEVLTLQYYDSEASANAAPTSDAARTVVQQIASLVDIEQAIKSREVYETLHKIGN